MTDPTQVLVGTASRCTLVIGKETKAALLSPAPTPEQALGHALLDSGVFDTLADRVAERLGESPSEPKEDRWHDTQSAAKYADMHPDTLGKKRRVGKIPGYQEGPNAKVYYRESDLDDLRQFGRTFTTSNETHPSRKRPRAAASSLRTAHGGRTP